ncbi:MAG: hypothetical protein KA711_12580 [Ideonella sp. WA131b]|nr:hypothetical protein [Ideonella sp. WA131b]
MSHPLPDRSFQSHPPRRGTVDVEEQRAWVGFYKRVGRDAALAAEVMAQLDGDAEMKRRHLALYLSCKQSLRVHKVRQARDKRIGQWLRLLVQLTLMRPVAFFGSATQRGFHRSADLLAEAITAEPQAAPATSKRGARPASGADSNRTVEPATAQVRSLLADAEFADAHARFQQQAGMSSVASPQHGSEPRDESPAPAVQVSRR